MQSENRKLLREYDRQQRRAEAAKEAADLAHTDLLAAHTLAEKRFGLVVPLDALLLDVLELVDVEPGEVWRWRGMRNNYGIPTVRHDRDEKSLPRYLAIAFGVISEDEYGVLYPVDDPEDMNPRHRTLRRTEKPIGNRRRYEIPASL